MYTHDVTAADSGGEYDIDVTVTDTVGNSITRQGPAAFKFTLDSVLPTISNLTSIYAYHNRQGNGAARAFWAWELAGTPQTAPERYRARSPLTHADRIRTPLLLIHAEQDTNCPIDQSEELCAALAARGHAVRLGRIPEEGHLLNLIGRPSHRLLRTAWLDGWFARYLRPAHPPAAIAPMQEER